MHRLLCDFDVLSADFPQLSGDAKTHLKVLRPKDGELFELFDGKGSVRVFSFCAREKSLVACGELQTLGRTSPHTITLFACVTKSSRWDWTIEKATELGADRIVPVLSDRTIVRIDRGERVQKRLRWEKIAQEAARQSDAKFVPEVLQAVDFREALDLVRSSNCFVGALMGERPKSLLGALRELPEVPPAGDYSVFIGPEGDFTPDELSSLVQIAVPVTLGERILRAETAAIYSLSVLSAFLRP